MKCSISQVTEQVKDTSAGRVGHSFRNRPRAPFDGSSPIENRLADPRLGQVERGRFG